MSFRFQLIILCPAFLITLSSAFAMTLPHVFGDHMVLQSGQSVPVWGWAVPGESITVNFAGQEKHAIAAVSDGRWEVQLDPLTVSSEPAELKITGRESIVYRDVLVGEVWLCSGQSNMQKPVGQWRGQPVPTTNSEQELATANYPLIRLMNEEISNADAPARDIDASLRPRQDYPWKGWVTCTPAALDEIKFSAVGYFFARKLHAELKVPIGMIEATCGGTHIEAWTPATGFATDPALAEFAKAARTPKVKFQGTTISTLYNGMIHPLVPFAMRGMLWYQGESNLTKKDGAIYANKMTALITSWRAAWGRDVPFYYVQLPPLLYSKRINPIEFPMAEPTFREAQAEALKLPGTGMVVTTDLGDMNNIHPPRKREIGERLALWALARDYGRKDIEPSGPLFRKVDFEGDKAVVRFDHIGKGLVSNDGQSLNWFSAAGGDGKFYPALATITGDTVVVTCAQVTQMKAIHFGWDEAATPNLFNKDGLPAIPFRTDNPFAPEPKSTIP